MTLTPNDLAAIRGIVREEVRATSRADQTKSACPRCTAVERIVPGGPHLPPGTAFYGRGEG